jgi:hypothetical protein
MLFDHSRLRKVFCSRGDAETRRRNTAEGSLSLLTSPLAGKFFEGATRKVAQLLRASASPRENILVLRECT